jgi:hypothetical protein
MHIMGNDKLQEKYQAFIRNSSEGIWLCELDEPVSIKLNGKNVWTQCWD